VTTTTNNKGVPRSRLNITYRTHIDGREVKKELPLRLLVAGDFSGRLKNKLPELPLLDRRLMYAIGQSNTLESVLSLMRVGLPVPKDLTHERTFEVKGHANVRVAQGGGGVLLVTQLQNASVEGSVAPEGAAATATAGASAAGDATAAAADATTASDASAAATKKDAGEKPSAAATASVNKATYEGQLKLSAIELLPGSLEGSITVPIKGLVSSGWLAPIKQPPREAPVMYQASKLLSLTLKFEDFLDITLVPREGLDRRVELTVKLEAQQVIPLLDMKSFDPERIAETIPELRRLLVLRWLVSQGRSLIASNPVLRSECKQLLPQPSKGGADDAAASSALMELVSKVAALNAQGVFALEKQW
jgi:predicted component of type VI protein secretion system